MSLTLLGVSLLFINLGGFYLAYLYGHKTRNFRWSEYLAIIILPVTSVVLLAFIFGSKVIVLFVEGALVGIFFEYIIGFTYHKTLNQRLWTYNCLSLSGYTSLLSIPMWGVAAVVFGFLSKIIGL